MLTMINGEVVFGGERDLEGRGDLALQPGIAD
jgi:hypothetical protein